MTDGAATRTDGWYRCGACGSMTPDDGFQPAGWVHTMDGRDLCAECRPA